MNVLVVRLQESRRASKEIILETSERHNKLKKGMTNIIQQEIFNSDPFCDRLSCSKKRSLTLPSLFLETLIVHYNPFSDPILQENAYERTVLKEINTSALFEL